MSMSKGSGGLGFRDLYGFNIALLGKQCWNFLNNLSSLVARFLRLDTTRILVFLKLHEDEECVVQDMHEL